MPKLSRRMRSPCNGGRGLLDENATSDENIPIIGRAQHLVQMSVIKIERVDTNQGELHGVRVETGSVRVVARAVRLARQKLSQPKVTARALRRYVKHRVFTSWMDVSDNSRAATEMNVLRA